MDFIKSNGLYKGIIVDTNDPSGKFHRVRVRIPKLHGTISASKINTNSEISTSESGAIQIGVEDRALPWCEVAYPYNTDFVPEVGQVVIVGFISGDTSKPIVLGWLGYEYTDKEEQFSAIDGDIIWNVVIE